MYLFWTGFCGLLHYGSLLSAGMCSFQKMRFGCFSPSRFSHFHCNTMRKSQLRRTGNLQTNLGLNGSHVRVSDPEGEGEGSQLST